MIHPAHLPRPRLRTLRPQAGVGIGVLLTLVSLALRPPWALGWSIGIGLLCALAACWWIPLLVAPVEEPAQALRRGDGAPRPPGVQPRRRNNVQQIAATVVRLQDTLTDRDPTVPTLEQRALRDPLTGLWNSSFLAEMTERLADDVAAARIEVCLLCLALDGFQPIHARHGHEAGDQVLVQVARRLRKLGRAQDFAFHLGGDEFLVLITCPPGEGAALSRTLAERIVNDMRRPMNYLTLNNLRVGCSIGAAVWPTHGLAFAEVMHHADEALCAARNAGRGQFRQYALAA
ncbi:GGDEF domain-containing protein [Rhizobacter sp. OV335]|uniref:GGDEF domain-containing protein n=1 Tax=Rhizobacter sp. OV335 TaxID=1500264 RepID=UPI000937261E|nr:GGDEF domain-containing protein [Rhizobacter sp. OV335]